MEYLALTLQCWKVIRHFGFGKENSIDTFFLAQRYESRASRVHGASLFLPCTTEPPGHPGLGVLALKGVLV